MTFEDHVRAALDSLPAKLREAMSNVEIVVEDENDEDPDLFAALPPIHNVKVAVV